MNNSLRRLAEPGKLPLIALVAFAAATLICGFYELAVCEGVVILVLILTGFMSKRQKEKEIQSYVESVAYEADNAKNNTLLNFPLPIAVFCIEDSRIIWGNEMFFRMCGEDRIRLDANFHELVPAFSGKWLTDGQTRYPTLLEVGGRKYQVHGNTVRSDADREDSTFMGISYWVDVTDYDEMRIRYENTRPVAGVVIVDNIDELTKNQPDRIKNDLREAIEDVLSLWCSGFKGIIRRYDRDRYFLMMDQVALETQKTLKFAITEQIHSILSPTGVAATVSIGLGADCESFSEALQSADAAAELALSRGGDQCVIKNRLGFEFYGGRGAEVEKRTKVKSRVVANVFRELVRDSQRVLVMGHRYSDLDSLGAAVGVCALARQLDVKAYIVCDTEKTAAGPLIEMLRKEPEYKDVFINPQEAALKTDVRTLLTVVDTSRPEQVEVPGLLRACPRVAVIDHHRAGATYIHDAALGFIEPYASSACELVTEILEEENATAKLLRCEAEAILSGIVLDTKNFTLRTGERTFDAAAALRRAGADTTAVKRLFQSDMDNTVARYKILQNAELYRKIAVAAPEEPQDRIVAAKAADELLNITGVDASVVIAPDGKGSIFASARSIGEVNVQIIMEKLGGGGNRSAAAAQLPDEELSSAVKKLYAAIDDYFG